MALQIEQRPLSELAPYAANARQHSKEQITQIAASIREFGFNVPLLVDDNGELIAGHGRLLAAKQMKLKTVPVIRLAHLSEAQVRAFRLADNQLALNASWDTALLLEELKALDAIGFAVDVIGFDDAELAEFAQEQTQDDLLLGEDEAKSALLELINVTFGEPRHQVASGDHYVLGGRHDLFCTSVICGFNQWGLAMNPGKLFCPYAGVFVPFARKAEREALVMVQPDPFICGHLLDRFEEAGKGEVVKR